MTTNLRLIQIHRRLAEIDDYQRTAGRYDDCGSQDALDRECIELEREQSELLKLISD